jgi:hypothetical protein
MLRTGLSAKLPQEDPERAAVIHTLLQLCEPPGDTACLERGD